VRQQERSELVGPPPGGRVFEHEFRAGFADCAPSGRVRLDALARWLQDVAYADVEDAGLAQHAVWVVRRTRIQVQRFPRFGERHTLATYCSGLGRMWGERRTTIRRSGEAEPDVETEAIWVHLDPQNWRPTPFHPDELELYGAAAAGRRVTARLRHPGPPASPARTRPWTFRTTELDIAGHVNNAAYWTPLEAELQPAEPVAIDAEVEFRTPGQPGQKRIVGDAAELSPGARRWVAEEAGETIASILVAALSTG
jgi:acyl-ACP thioesterase